MTVASLRTGDEDEIRGTELERSRALRDRDINAAERPHAEDFELITPDGVRLTKDTCLAGIRTGAMRYLRWEPDDIRVHVYDEGAAARYTSTIEIIDDRSESSIMSSWARGASTDKAHPAGPPIPSPTGMSGRMTKEAAHRLVVDVERRLRPVP